jgi:hypothetical protein
MKAPVLPDGVIRKSHFLDQLTLIADTLIQKGQGHEYNSLLRKVQVNQDLIVRRYREGKTIGQIKAETGWFDTNIQKVLEQAGLIEKKKAEKPRVRGVKEDAEY